MTSIPQMSELVNPCLSDSGLQCVDVVIKRNAYLQRSWSLPCTEFCSGCVRNGRRILRIVDVDLGWTQSEMWKS